MNAVAAPMQPPSATRTPQRRASVLLVDDSAADVELTRDAFESSGAAVDLHVTVDGVQALEYLRQRGAHAGAPTPDLILLDLNMPRLDGRGVLAEVKQDPRLCRIPVIVFTSSSAPNDVAAAYALHANCFVTKPVELASYLAVIHAIDAFWLRIATAPPQAA